MATDCLIPHLLGQANRFDSTTWIALVIGCAATMYVMYRARRKAKRDPLDQHPINSSMAQQRAVERQMSNLLIELSEMARTVNATIETRTVKLEALIDAADQRIETLRALSDSTAANHAPATRRGEREIVATVTASRGLSPPTAMTTTATTTSSTGDDRHTQIYQLADHGRSVDEIAAALNRPSGEIELILALRSREVVTQ